MTHQPAVALILACLALLTGCRSNVAELRDWMTGSFSSQAQHASDPEHYFDIRLHTAEIWKDRSDGPWLYVEQAAASALDRPYRQRVYRLAACSRDCVHSIIHALPGDAQRYVGAWREDEPLADLVPEDLALLEGCSVILRRRSDGVFEGATVDDACSSSWRDADYVTSLVTVTATEMISWDRGYDAAHQQVWGATEGGYVFIKQEDEDVE